MDEHAQIRKGLLVLVQLCAFYFARARPTLFALFCACSRNFAHPTLRPPIYEQIFASYLLTCLLSKTSFCAQRQANMQTSTSTSTCKQTCKRARARARAKEGAQRGARKGERAMEGAQRRARIGGRAQDGAHRKARKGQNRKNAERFLRRII